MELSAEQCKGIGRALNEARLIGAEVDPEHRAVYLTLSVLSLPADSGPPPDDGRVSIILGPVGRLAASLRYGRWDDNDALVEAFTAEQLLDVVQSFGGSPVYGWEFVDTPDEDFASWSGRLSLDWRDESGSLAHTIQLFQEGVHDGQHRHLDLRIWFEDFLVYTPDGDPVSLEDFTAAGTRWWDGLYAGDPRTQGAGIQPLRNRQTQG